jgi:hypothetical protein
VRAVADDLVLRGEFDAASIVARRAVPRVFLVDAGGDLLAWSTRSAGTIEPEVQTVVRRYVAGPGGRFEGVELVRAGDQHLAVRILPQYDASAPTFAVIVERFALRDEATRRA